MYCIFVLRIEYSVSGNTDVADLFMRVLKLGINYSMLTSECSCFIYVDIEAKTHTYHEHEQYCMCTSTVAVAL